jgi:HEAT repeat protein
MKAAGGILREALQQPEPFLAAEAARLIGEWNGRALVPDLIEYIRVNRFYSKVTGIYALARLAAAEAAPHLSNLVDRPNVSEDRYWYGAKGVRAAAAVTLLQFGNISGVPYLRELAEKRDRVFFRWFAPSLLRQKAAPELQTYLTLENLCPTEEQRRYFGAEFSDPGMLCMLCEALELLPEPEAEARLDFYTNHYSRFVRGQAFRSLNRRRPDKALTQRAAHSAAKHGTDFDRIIAAKLGRDSHALLVIARDAPAAFDRGSAIDALAAFASPALPEAARHALEDTDAYVRQCAVEALGRQTGVAAQADFEKLLGYEKEARVMCAIAATRLEGEGAC